MLPLCLKRSGALEACCKVYGRGRVYLKSSGDALQACRRGDVCLKRCRGMELWSSNILLKFCDSRSSRFFGQMFEAVCIVTFVDGPNARLSADDPPPSVCAEILPQLRDDLVGLTRQRHYSCLSFNPSLQHIYPPWLQKALTCSFRVRAVVVLGHSCGL